MSNHDTSITGFLHGLALRVRRGEARRNLLARSDRELADMGVSRALLEDGIAAWPWRETAGSGSQPAPVAGGRRHPSDRPVATRPAALAA